MKNRNILIILLSVLLLGGLVCWMRMSRELWLQQVAKVYIDLMRGTPEPSPAGERTY